ncbi:MAG: ABC transporter substrate-binding protein [Dehalococcoidia bacterium]|nr:ABC transporter substrate-binding protein [Dehalococcoidia bacterium]
MTPALLAPPRPLVAPPEDATRREFITGVGAAALAAAFLAACRDGGDDSDSGSGTWRYENEFGSTELPRTIERVVSIDYFTPPALIDLGLLPVGVVNDYLSGEAIPSEYREALIGSGARAVSISAYWDTDIEAVAAAEPDLIIATNDQVPADSPVREQLEQIAPLVALPAHSPGSWLTRSTEIAKILGREDELARLRSEYEEARDEIRERHVALLDQLTFAVFSPFADQWTVSGKGSYSSEVLLDLGAHFIDEDVPELALDETGGNAWLPYEQLRLLNGADVILHTPNTEAAFAALQDNPVWATLPAVQQGMVFPYIKFSATSSYSWAMQNLRDLDALLAEVQAHLDAE